MRFSYVEGIVQIEIPCLKDSNFLVALFPFAFMGFRLLSLFMVKSFTACFRSTQQAALTAAPDIDFLHCCLLLKFLMDVLFEGFVLDTNTMGFHYPVKKLFFVKFHHNMTFEIITSTDSPLLKISSGDSVLFDGTTIKNA